MLVVDYPWLFFSSIPLVALLYASIGHGGASGYLALMALFGAQTTFMKPIALLLNIFVAALAFYHYQRKGHFSWNLFFPFALASVPAAFIGGFIQPEPTLYKQILGILLLVSVFRLLMPGKDSTEKRNAPLWLSLLIGAGIGFFSGLIGIGGGIILSPIILLLHWADMKQTAAVSALFILINSVSGLTGMMVSGASIPIMGLVLLVLALIGGWIGARLGSGRMNQTILKLVLAAVLVIAGTKLLFV